MDREETRKAAAVMLAFADGADIEYQSLGTCGEWMVLGGPPRWNWHTSRYRIAPDPPPFRVDGPGLYRQRDGGLAWVSEVVPLEIFYPVRGVNAGGDDMTWTVCRMHHMDGRESPRDLVAKAS